VGETGAEEIVVRRVEHEGSSYLHISDLLKACKDIRDASWRDGLCTAAMVMDSLCEFLDRLFDETKSGLK
jgi:hypothetical protein